MKLLNGRNLKLALFLSCGASILFLGGINQSAQTKVQIPERTGYVNDFAGVIDEKTRLQLGTILENVKQKAGIEFTLVTVESTAGQDIFDFSRQLATEWKIGSRSSARKSLLLVLAVNEKTAFTQFSRSVQKDLPEGVLGEMGQRMRKQVTAGHFSEGLEAGIRFFVGSMAQKLALSVDDFEKGPATAEADLATNKTVEPAPAITAASPSEAPRTVTRSADVREERVPTTTNRSAEPASVSDEDESEEVELTLTLPLEARVMELRAFLEARPDSKSKPRALELLVSARAGLGDERLKKGDNTGGVEQLMMAIADAPVDASEKLFSGVISQIPLNLYLRGERAAAFKAAENIEAKFGSDPKRLLAVSGFYIGTEQGSEATRVAKRAVSLAPDSAEAHQALGLALHISLRLEEAAAEYKRALELDPNSKGARRGLADLTRASGRAEDALALYRQQLVVEPADKAARAGLVLSLLELGRTDEAKTELEAALNADPRNLTLLAGAAYWFAAHNEFEKALEFGSKAFQIEPRYIWSQVAVARALLAQRKPLEAERIVRFARQHGKFPTLDYELASALAAAGLYDEAAEVLLPAFTVTNGEIETRLGGHALARNASFIDLLAPERRASTFQFAAADTENNAKTLKALLNFASLLDPEKNGGTIDQEKAIAAARAFASGNDPARVHRQLYAASRLMQRGIGFQTAYELAEAARNSAEAGLNVPALTVVVQADEFREIRARAISAGGTPAIPDAPRNVLANLLRGRIEDISGWALFNQDKLDEAADHLRRAVNILPEGTPAWRTSLWHLGATLDRLDKEEEALGYYIRSYNSGEPDPIRRTVIEQLYRKVKGSLEGLDEQIRPAAPAVNAPVADRAASTSEPTTAIALPESSPQTLPTGAPVIPSTPAADALPTPSPVVEALPTSSPEVRPTPEETAQPTPEPTPTPAAEVPTPEAAAPSASEPSPTPTPDSTPTPTPTPARRSLFDPRPDPGDTPAETISKPRATVVTITGRVKDAGNNPIANVVVVLISQQGTVLASTTNEEGIYVFKVAPSTHSYRLIPSKDGFTFEPLDKLLPGVTEDQKEMNFIAVPNKVP